MSMFKNLTTDKSINEATDTLGGGGAVESGLYDLKIKMAYGVTAKSEAMGVTLVLLTADNKEIRFTEYVTSGKEKGCKNYYEKDGEKHYLPGYNNINAVALLAAGKELHELETEEKSVKLYDFTAKAEVPTKVPVLVDLIGKEITLGILKVIENKTSLNEATGKYEPTAETRTLNQLDKVFRTRDHMTVAEVRAQAEEPAFYDAWGAKNTGNTRDKSKAVSGAPKGAVAGKPKTSLFG